MPGTPHTCTREDRAAGNVADCYACQETAGPPAPRRPTVTDGPRPIDVRAALAAAGIKPGAVEVRDAITTPGAVVVRLRNPRANHTAQLVGRALEATAYRLELPAVAGLWLVHAPARVAPPCFYCPPENPEPATHWTRYESTTGSGGPKTYRCDAHAAPGSALGIRSGNLTDADLRRP